MKTIMFPPWYQRQASILVMNELAKKYNKPVNFNPETIKNLDHDRSDDQYTHMYKTLMREICEDGYKKAFTPGGEEFAQNPTRPQVPEAVYGQFKSLYSANGAFGSLSEAERKLATKQLRIAIGHLSTEYLRSVGKKGKLKKQIRKSDMPDQAVREEKEREAWIKQYQLNVVTLLLNGLVEKLFSTPYSLVESFTEGNLSLQNLRSKKTQSDFAEHVASVVSEALAGVDLKTLISNAKSK